MRRQVFVALYALSLALLTAISAGPGIARAQDVAAVPVANEDGVTVGSIAVEEVIDPFTDVDPAYPPEAGSRYVVARVAFAADAGQRFDITPWTIVLQDEDGFLWNPASLILPDDSLYPELTSQTLAPGSRVTGLVGYSLSEGAAPARVYYQPVSSRLVLLASLIDSPAPEVGATVPVLDAEGNEGAVTVADVIDPLELADPAAVAPEGTRLVQVTLRYENPGEGRFFSEPYGLLVKDANGDLWSAAYVNRMTETEVIPDLTRVQLAPGDRITGAATFAVPLEVPLAGIYLSPTSNQLIQLAALGTVAGAATPVATGSDDAIANDPCAELETWAAATSQHVLRGQELSAVLPALLDPAEFAAAASELERYAEEQAGSVAPTGAEPLSKALVTTLRALAGIAGSAAASGSLGADDLATIERASNRLAAIETELAAMPLTC